MQKNHIFSANISARNLFITNKTIYFMLMKINESWIKIISSADKNCIKNATEVALFSYRIPLVLFFAVGQERSKSRENSQTAARQRSFSIVANDITSAMQLRHFREIYRRETQQRQQRAKKGACSCDELIYFLIATNNKEHESSSLHLSLTRVLRETRVSRHREKLVKIISNQLVQRQKEYL